MFRSLYNFKATHATALAFSEGELFVELPGAKNDKNWYFVAGPDGRSGYVPRNYVQNCDISPADKHSHLTAVIDTLRNNDSLAKRDKREVCAKLEEIRAALGDTLTNNTQALRYSTQGSRDSLQDAPGPLSRTQGSRDSLQDAPGLLIRTQGSKDSLSSIRSSKKRAAPQPPVRKPQERSSSEGSEQSPRNSPRPSASSMDTNETIPEDRESLAPTSTRSSPNVQKPPIDKNSAQNATSNLVIPDIVTCEQKSESCRSKSLRMVEMVRSNTGVSHAISQDLLLSIFKDLLTSKKDLNILIPSLVHDFSQPLFATTEEIESSQDNSELVQLFDALTESKEDEQQRNWKLHEDEAVICENLRRVCETLQLSNPHICKHVLSRYKYFYVQSLVEYYQMETRWSIRKLLIETFTVMCSLDFVIISLMLNSVLPLELAQDMYENHSDVERLKHSAIILTFIFSRGEPAPLHYLEKQLGHSFVNFLLDKIENRPEQDLEDEIPDAFMGLIASYNLQFPETPSNIFLKCLAQTNSAKIFTEKLLLLLNREEDPAAVINPDTEQINSIHKLVLDTFSSDGCINHFYTNDLMVLIDIIVRQLSDLGPGVHRYTYLEMAHLVLTRSDYEQHQHRVGDLRKCLERIRNEEGDTIDKTKVHEICNAFSCFHLE